jgi:hypothetical protein
LVDEAAEHGGVLDCGFWMRIADLGYRSGWVWRRGGVRGGNRGCMMGV